MTTRTKPKTPKPPRYARCQLCDAFGLLKQEQFVVWEQPATGSPVGRYNLPNEHTGHELRAVGMIIVHYDCDNYNSVHVD